jgi:hypothetical protein
MLLDTNPESITIKRNWHRLIRIRTLLKRCYDSGNFGQLEKSQENLITFC